MDTNSIWYDFIQYRYVNLTEAVRDVVLLLQALRNPYGGEILWI